MWGQWSGYSVLVSVLMTGYRLHLMLWDRCSSYTCCWLGNQDGAVLLEWVAQHGRHAQCDEPACTVQ